MGLIPGQGANIPRAVQPNQKKKRNCFVIVIHWYDGDSYNSAISPWVLALHWAPLEYVTQNISFKLWAWKRITTFLWYKWEDRSIEKTPRTELELTQPASRAQSSRAASLRSTSWVPRTKCLGSEHLLDVNLFNPHGDLLPSLHI